MINCFYLGSIYFIFSALVGYAYDRRGGMFSCGRQGVVVVVSRGGAPPLMLLIIMIVGQRCQMHPLHVVHTTAEYMMNISRTLFFISKIFFKKLILLTL